MKKSNVNGTKYKLLIAIIKKTIIALFWLGLWQLISIRVGQELLVPSVDKVFATLLSLLSTAIFWQITVNSIFRIIIGFSIGVILGTLLAVITYASKTIHDFFKPILSIIKATPIVSFIILALVWIKGGNIPSFISFLMVFPIVWGNVYEGISSTDHKLIEMAKVYKLRRLLVLRKIYLGSVFPFLAAAATTSMGLAWKAGIAAEVIATPGFSIGRSIHDSKIYLQTAELFAWSIVVIIFSVLLEKALSQLLEKISPSLRRVKKNAEYNTSMEYEIFDITKQEVLRNEESTDNIIIDNITVEYDKQIILKDFSAKLPSRGCVCFFGKSGSGKTTLINAISGLKRPIKGEIYSVENVMPSFSYVFQEDRLIPWISALENVKLVLHNSQIENFHDASANILSQLGLKDSLNKFPNELSGGMKQRVNIARAIAYDADVMILDEPFKGLDQKAKDELIDLFIQLKKIKLLILVSHDKSDIDRLADKIINVP